MCRIASLALAPAQRQKSTQSVELANIVRTHRNELLRQKRLPLHHLQVLRSIMDCRTDALGGHRKWCEDCGYEHFIYHSCRNRHCPKCQTRAKEAWREARKADLLPVPYFHQVFTLPHEFNEWILAGERNQRLLLKALFDCTAGTLLAFGCGELDGQLGFTLVLHTWDQQLRPHYHLHCLVPAGALSHEETSWHPGGSKFLFPVHALSKKFRGKFLDAFSGLVASGKLKLPARFVRKEQTPRSMIKKLRKKAWVVYSKVPFAGPAKMLDYLSRYTHRVAISNDRILGLADGQVTFAYRDRADGDRKKEQTIGAVDFLKRFLQHVLPARFTRIRHYGFLSNRNRKKKLQIIRRLLGVPAAAPLVPQTLACWLESILGRDPDRCPRCGGMLQEEEFEGRQALRLDPLNALQPPADWQRHSRGPPRVAS